MTWIKGFFIEGQPQSSKRLTMILSYIVTLLLCIISVIFHMPIETNVLTLLLGCCGVSTGGYVAANNKQEVKNVD